MQRTSLVSLGLLTALLATVGCGDDKQATATDTANEPSTSDPTTVATTDTTTEPGTETEGTVSPTTEEPTQGTSEAPTTTDGECAGPSDPGEGAEGTACTANGDCESESCLKWTDGQTDAVCGPRAECNNTRFIGTIFDFDTKAPVAGAELRVVGALSALQGPENAVPLVTTTSDANGRIDVTTETPINQGIGVIGVVTGENYYLTATGLAQPYPATTSYPPLNAIHDIWAVPLANLIAWTDLLQEDPDPVVGMNLPLGGAGGVIGLVRKGDAGVADAVVVSEKADSTAVIRYLNEDGMGFNADATSSNGVFVLVNPGLAERFTVEVGGAPTGLSGTAGSSANAAFVLIFNVP
jgi:hypothetical protein